METKLQEVFREIFDDDELVISREMSAKDIPDWDSLTNMQLIISVENTFGVKFTTSEILKLKNVGEFIDCLSAKLSLK